MRTGVPAFLLPGLQPDRRGVRQDQAPAAQGRGQDQGGLGRSDRGGAIRDQLTRRPGLLRACRIHSSGSATVKRAVTWLSRLVDKSLVLAGEQGGEARYHLLETVREYGQERLQDSGEAARTRRRHGAFFLDLAERAESGLTGARQGWWLARLEAELDNLRAAIVWSLGEEPEAGLRLAGALWEFCYMRGHYGEGREWLEGALARSGGSSPAFYAKALAGAGILDLLQCEYDRATALLEESLAIYKELEDGWGIGSALQSLGSIARERGRYAEAEALHNESLALQRELGNEEGIARSLDGLGFAAWLQ